MNRSLFSTGVKDDWETPPEFFHELDQEFHFTLDPCCTPHTAKCKNFYTPEENGLEQDWGGRLFSAILHTPTRKVIQIPRMNGYGNAIPSL